MGRASPKTFADVRAAFASRSVLRASGRELEELMAAVASESFPDAAERARAHEMSQALRELLQNQARRQPSKLAFLAVFLALGALICSGTQAYYSWSAYTSALESTREMSDFMKALRNSDGSLVDLRTETTVAELARRAPSLRTGTLQAWWAGEQARQVLRLEAQAKRQVLAGDRAGAAQSASRADAIRSALEPLAAFERPPQR